MEREVHAVGRVDVAGLLTSKRREVIDQACAAVDAAHAMHYERSGGATTRTWISELFDQVLGALHDRRLAPVGAFCEELAERRFASGFPMSEVQTAFNALEVAMWQEVVEGVPPDQLAEAIGLLSTIVGFGKDALARRYVSLASRRHVPTLDLSALFAGTDR